MAPPGRVQYREEENIAIRKHLSSRPFRWVLCLTCAVAGAKPVRAQALEVVIHNFGGDSPLGTNPGGGVIRDASGNLYGTTAKGGFFNQGVIYKIDTAGHSTTLYNFTGGSDGSQPVGSLARDRSGNLYGTTSSGYGAVFRLDQTGQLTVVHAFSGAADGYGISSGVIIDEAGNLYGTTSGGGPAAFGKVFKLTPAGQQVVLYTFTGGNDGGCPAGPIARDAAGAIYGTTICNIFGSKGLVYKLDPTGRQKVLHTFTGGADGGNPYAGVIHNAAGNLYGTALTGGTSGYGVLYQLDSTGRETVLHNFTGGADGGSPYGGVAYDADGNVYGTTTWGGAGNCSASGFPTGCGVIFQVDSANNFRIVHSFTGDDGANPTAGLILGGGRVYGTAPNGGPVNWGTVFEVSPGGHEFALHSFGGAREGAHPYAGVIQDAKGNLYGTTSGGGLANAGVIFRQDVHGPASLLHTFTGLDGADPVGAMAIDAAGNLYGATAAGGPANAGVVYRVDAAGIESVLYSFAGGSDGATPGGGLVMDAAGNLYGTTAGGGASGDGVVYKIDRAGNETVLHSFSGAPDGQKPAGNLLLDKAGNLYGTTTTGGSANSGIVYEISPAGDEAILYTFLGGHDGANPLTGLTADAVGNLYGTTALGGRNNDGTIYSINKLGQKKTLHSFAGGDGQNPAGPLFLAKGKLYGTANQGGAGSGVVFSYNAQGLQVLYSFPGGASGRNPSGSITIDAAGNLFGTAINGGSQADGVLYTLRGVARGN